MKEMMLQRRANSRGESAAAPPIVYEVLRSPGQPLDRATREYMSTRFNGNFSRVATQSQAQLALGRAGDSYEQEADAAADRIVTDAGFLTPIYDFSQVRVHTDFKAAESADAVNALAYTVGSHIVFGAGQYAPSSISGKRLVAHELTHVIQQGGSAVNDGRTVQTQILQRDEDEGGDEGKEEKKPKSPFDPPDQLGKCSFDILNPGKFVNCCTEAIGDAEICSDQVRKFKDFFNRFKDPCPGPAKKPDGTCCPLPMIWDGLKGKCSKTVTPLGKPTVPPVSPAPSFGCLPGEKPNLYGGCCKPGEKVDKRGMPCIPETPAAPKVPPGGPPPSGAPVASPPGNLKLHFNLDKPAVGVAATEDSLLKSLVPGDKSQWTSLLTQLRSNPSWKFQLVGKASPEGPDTYNLDLGKRRAQLVAKILMDKGIDRSRIVEVTPECTQVESGIYTCGETDAAGPEDRQVKVLFSGAAGPTP